MHCLEEVAKKSMVVVSGGWLRPILVFSLGLDQAEQHKISAQQILPKQILRKQICLTKSIIQYTKPSQLTEYPD